MPNNKSPETDYPSALPPEVRRRIAPKPKKRLFGKTVRLGPLTLVDTAGRTDETAAPHIAHNLEQLLPEDAVRALKASAEALNNKMDKQVRALKGGSPAKGKR